MQQALSLTASSSSPSAALRVLVLAAASARGSLRQAVERQGHELLAVVQTVDKVREAVQAARPGLVLLVDATGRELRSWLVARHVAYECLVPTPDQPLATAVELALLRHDRTAARRRQHEADLLLSLSTDMATIRDQDELRQVMREKVQPLLGFNVSVSTVYSSDYSQYRYLLFSGVLDEQLPAEQSSGLRDFRPVAGTWDEWVLRQDDVCQLSLADEARPAAANSEVGGMLKALGIRQSLYIKLRAGGRVIGVQHFHFTDKTAPSQRIVALAQAIAKQIAAAVANTLANEVLIRREQEKSVLLSVSEAIATVRERKELLTLIINKVKPVIPINDTGILILDRTGENWQDWTNVDNYQGTAGAVQSQQLGLDQWLPVDSFLHHALNNSSILAVAPFRQQYPEHPFGPLLWEAGVREFIFTPLVNGGKKLGVLVFDSEREGTYTLAHLALLKTIADLMAAAVANILVNEEILVREREKSTLLSISETIATVRGKEDLLRVIVAKIKPLLPFYDCGILVVDEQRQTYVDLAATYPAIDDSAVNHYLHQAGIYDAGGRPYPGSLVEWIMQQLEATQRPLLIDYEVDYPGFNEAALLSTLRQQGYKEGLGGLLQIGGRPFGFFMVNALQRGTLRSEQHALFQSIAEQLSGAVANILANEDILRQAREQDLLLNVAQAIATVHRKEELLRTIFDLVEPVFHFEDLGLAILDADQQHVTDWTAAMSDLSDSSVNQVLRAQEQARMFYPGTLLEHTVHDIERAGAPLIIGITQELANQWPDAVYLPVEIEQGLTECLMTTLKVAGQLLGTFNLNSRQPGYFATTDVHLFQAIADQIAVAVANILANEEIERREQEKELQLAVTTALTNSQEWADKFQVVFDALSAWTFTPERLIHFTVLRRDNAGFEDITEPSRAAYPDLEATETEVLLTRNLQPMVYTGEAFAEQCAQYFVYRIRRDTFGVASTMELPLPVRNGIRSLVVLTSRVAYAFTEADLQQLLLFTPQIALAVENLVAHEELRLLKKREEQEKTYLAEEIKTTHNFEEMVGVSPALHQVFRQVGQVAGTDATVLITGETGTGKELIARTLHNQSKRRARTLIKLNCAALPAQLIESELFGHEKGAFTGAIDKRVGKFELAQGSTIFLDEIGELPLELQSKLLRVLQEREFERVGGNKVFKADVRVVAATNRNLAEEVAAGRFRADLFYRLSVFPIHMPALRERPEDIPLLAQHFARKFSRTLGKPHRGIQPLALQELLAYDWPGNIRELENLVEQAVIVCPGPLEWARTLRPTARLGAAPELPPAAPVPGTLREEREGLERNRILLALAQAKGRIRGPKGAAQALGLKPTTLESKMGKLGIRKEPRYAAEAAPAVAGGW